MRSSLIVSTSPFPASQDACKCHCFSMFSLALEDNPIESRAQSHKRSRMIEVTMATLINTWMKKKKRSDTRLAKGSKITPSITNPVHLPKSNHQSKVFRLSSSKVLKFLLWTFSRFQWFHKNSRMQNKSASNDVHFLVALKSMIKVSMNWFLILYRFIQRKPRG